MLYMPTHNTSRNRITPKRKLFPIIITLFRKRRALKSTKRRREDHTLSSFSFVRGGTAEDWDTISKLVLLSLVLEFLGFSSTRVFTVTCFTVSVEAFPSTSRSSASSSPFQSNSWSSSFV